MCREHMSCQNGIVHVFKSAGAFTTVRTVYGDGHKLVSCSAHGLVCAWDVRAPCRPLTVATLRPRAHDGRRDPLCAMAVDGEFCAVAQELTPQVHLLSMAAEPLSWAAAAGAPAAAADVGHSCSGRGAAGARGGARAAATTRCLVSQSACA